MNTRKPICTSHIALHCRTSFSLVGNESVPRIIINNTINFLSVISIFVLPNHNDNSVRVLIDKIASVYFIWKIYLIYAVNIGNGHHKELALCQLYRHTFVPRWRDVTRLATVKRVPNDRETCRPTWLQRRCSRRRWLAVARHCFDHGDLPALRDRHARHA